MQQDLAEKVILITGGTQGIGRETVIHAAKRGARVVYCGRRLDRLQNLQKELDHLGFGKTSLGIKADIANETDVHHLFDTAQKNFGQIDIVINNAAITRDFLLLSMPIEAWKDVMATNLTGVFLVSKYAINIFAQQKYGGKILTVGSIAQNGSPSAVAYATSKGGLVGLTKYIANEFGSKNISANLISFGIINTDIVNQYPEIALKTIKDLSPFKRIGQPIEAASALLFFATLSTIAFNGQCIYVSGGLHEIPVISINRN